MRSKLSADSLRRSSQTFSSQLNWMFAFCRPFVFQLINQTYFVNRNQAQLIKHGLEMRWAQSGAKGRRRKEIYFHYFLICHVDNSNRIVWLCARNVSYVRQRKPLVVVLLRFLFSQRYLFVCLRVKLGANGTGGKQKTANKMVIYTSHCFKWSSHFARRFIYISSFVVEFKIELL